MSKDDISVKMNPRGNQELGLSQTLTRSMLSYYSWSGVDQVNQYFHQPCHLPLFFLQASYHATWPA